MSGENIEIGFVEELSNPLLFGPEYFPSKVGGHPAWLNPSNVPNVPLCSQCRKPLIFLVQVYAGMYTLFI